LGEVDGFAIGDECKSEVVGPMSDDLLSRLWCFRFVLDVLFVANELLLLSHSFLG
jgi:hypothetical protein